MVWASHEDTIALDCVMGGCFPRLAWCDNAYHASAVPDVVCRRFASSYFVISRWDFYMSLLGGCMVHVRMFSDNGWEVGKTMSGGHHDVFSAPPVHASHSHFPYGFTKLQRVP